MAEMADDATASAGLKTLFSKRIKIGGVDIPVMLIVAALGVAVLAVVAWRMRDSTLNEAGTTDSDTDASDDTGAADTSGLQRFVDTGGGTVYANSAGFPGQPTDSDFSGADNDTDDVDTPVDNTPKITSNDEWVKQGTTLLISKGISGGDALKALSTYVDGGQLSYTEGQWRDDVIKEYGVPPDPFIPGGTGAAPIKLVQGTPPLVHTVKYVNKDDDYTRLVALYYNATGEPARTNAVDKLQAANLNLGHAGPFPIGTKVNIPAWGPPRYYTVVKGVQTETQIAAKNGLSVAALRELNDADKYNPKITYPAKVGTKVRVA